MEQVNRGSLKGGNRAIVREKGTLGGNSYLSEKRGREKQFDEIVSEAGPREGRKIPANSQPLHKLKRGTKSLEGNSFQGKGRTGWNHGTTR